MKFNPALNVSAHDLYPGGVMRPERELVAVKGVFDLTHAGHVELMRRASRIGDYLVVLVASDESVRNSKGIGRPVLTFEERQEIVSSLGYVDFVCQYSIDNLFDTLYRIRPNHFCASHFTYFSRLEVDAFKSAGVEFHEIPKPSCHSTSEIINSIRKGVN